MVDYPKALAYFQNLYLVAIADSQLVRQETSFLIQVAEQFGIMARDTFEIMSRSKELEMVVPETEEERLAQLEDIITMMMVDRKIHEKEYNLCLKFAELIGYDKRTFDLLILKIASGE